MKQRVLTAALLIPPVLLAVFLSSFWPFFVLSAIVLVLSYREVAALANSRFPVSLIGVLALLLILARKESFDSFWAAHPTLFGGLAEPWWLAQKNMLSLCLGVQVIGAIACLRLVCGWRGFFAGELCSLWLLSGICSLVLSRPDRYRDSFSLGDVAGSVLLCLLPIWVGDTIAIFVGKAWGKHSLAPKISPKKTVEGAIANLVGCLVTSIGLAELIGQPLLVGVLVGLATGVLGQLGDLLESAMKRSAGVKDSGKLLPGHGGLLDRIDSILLSAPAVALIVVTLGNRA